MSGELDIIAFSQEQFESWHDDPIKFCRDVFPEITLEDWQTEALQALSQGDLVAFIASKGVGKSFLEAVVGFWWMVTRKQAQVICTSIDADNLKKGLWKEIEGLYRRSAFLQAAFEMNSEQVYARPDDTGLVTPWGRDEWSMSSKGWRQRADAIEQAQALAGIHGDHMLWLGDEAGSYHNAILASGEAMRANIGNGREAKILLGGNPTDPSGPLGTIRNDKDWRIIKINGDPDNPKRCKRISVEWARKLIDQRGRDDPWVKVTVFGEFPDVGFNALLGPSDVEASIRRSYMPPVYERAQKRMGVDVARFGDDQSVIYIRQGLMAGPWWELSGLDTMQLADRVVLEFKRNGCEMVFIDETGVGAGVVDAVRRQLKGTGRVVAVNSADKATEFEKYHNKRAELCWTFADWVKNQHGQIPMADSKLREELIQPTYNFKGARILIEEKAQIKERLGRSPDNYDALLQTFALQEMPSMGPQGLSMLHALAEKRRKEYDDPNVDRVGDFNPNPD
jgi:hypothetical protein